MSSTKSVFLMELFLVNDNGDTQRELALGQSSVGDGCAGVLSLGVSQQREDTLDSFLFPGI